MTIGTAPNDNGRDLASASQERAALEGMLKGYPVEQLVEEILVAWDELSSKNDELVDVKQRLRVVELDLADRRDNVAPELVRLNEAEHQLQEADAQI
ncbi:MAG: hypothetical protein ACPHK2_05100, partial [Candidatus Poseidoniaceae archaeon]